MIKKAAAVCLAAAVSAFSLPCMTAFAQPAAAESAYFLWFKDQLNETAGKFYTAMENMRTTGVFAQGDALYDVTDLVGQSALAGYAQGNTQLLYDMGAARDAFAADHPELFYVDFSQLTLRVTSADGKYYATLGAGRSATYFAEGIDAATLNQKIALLNEKVEEIASGVPDGSDRQKATYVHDKIVNDLCDYARETQAKEENAAFVHSAYGALVCGESVCEGYAKSYKLVMDTLHIPCVTVQGLYESPTSGGVQEHMWNCVQIDDVWYAVDATMDDPKGYAPTHEYLLCDASAMADTHFADGVMSEANFEFTYPAVQNVTMQSGEGDSRFTVTTGNRQQSGDIISYDIAVSFNGMGCAAAAEAGYYFLIDYNQSDNWGYIVPSLYGGSIRDESDVMTFTVYNNVDSVQFAVTEEPLPDQSNGPDLYFKGDSSTLVKSGMVAPEFGEKYYAPPYVYSVTPSNQSTITPDREYEVVITYTKDLQKTGEVKVNLSSTNQIATNTSKVTDVSWDDSRPRELRFLFQPSATYGGDTCLYTFDIEGLVGTDSGKKPMGVSLYAKHTAFYGCPHADGWQVFGKPALIANGDMSANGWEYADGSKVADDVSFRIALIASQPADQTKYEDAVKDLGVSPVSSQTYNLTLNLCDKQVSQLADGQRMKIMLPYPDGYDPALAGTTFKAYHFDKDGKPEEIECFMNEYGIVIFCRSFSPFTVVEVAKSQTAKKNVLIALGKGGSASHDLVTLTEGSTGVDIQPAAGYVIDSVTVGGKQMTQFNADGFTLNLNYAELAQNTTVDVKFVAKSVKETEAAAGRTVVVPDVSLDTPGTIDIPPANDGAFIAIVVSACTVAAVAAGVAIVLVVKEKNAKKN